MFFGSGSGPERGLAGLQRRRLQAELSEADGCSNSSSKLAKARSQEAQYLLSAYRASVYRPALRASATAALTAARIPVPGSNCMDLLSQRPCSDNDSDGESASEPCELEEEAVVEAVVSSPQPPPPADLQAADSQERSLRERLQVTQQKVPAAAAAPAAAAQDVSTSGLRASPPLPPPVISLPEELWKRLLLALRRFHTATENASRQESRGRNGSVGATGSSAAASATAPDSAFNKSKLRMGLLQERNKPIEQELEAAFEELHDAVGQLPTHHVAQSLNAEASAPLGRLDQGGKSASGTNLFGHVLGPSACASSRALMLAAAHCQLLNSDQVNAIRNALDLTDQHNCEEGMEAVNRAVEARVRADTAATVLADALLLHSGLPALPRQELAAVAGALGRMWTRYAPPMTCAPPQAAQVAGDEGDGASGAGVGAAALQPAAACPTAVSLEVVVRLVRLCADEVLAQRDMRAEMELAQQRRAQQSGRPGGSRAALPPMPQPRQRPGQHSSMASNDEDADGLEQAITIERMSSLTMTLHWAALDHADDNLRRSGNKSTSARRWMAAYCECLKQPIPDMNAEPELLRMCILRARDQLPGVLTAATTAIAAAAGAAAASSGTPNRTADGGALSFQPLLPAALAAGAGRSLGIAAAAREGQGPSGGASVPSAGLHGTAALRTALARAMMDVAVNGRRLSLLVSCDMLSRVAALTAVASALRARGLPHADALLAPEVVAGSSNRSSSGSGCAVGRAALQGYGPIFLRFSLAPAASGASAAPVSGPAQVAAGTAVALQVSLVPGGVNAARAVQRICAGARRQAGSASSVAAVAAGGSSCKPATSQPALSRNVIEFPVGGLSAFDPVPSCGQAEADEAGGAPAAGTAPQQHRTSKQQPVPTKGKGTDPQAPQPQPTAVSLGAHAQALQQYRQRLKDSVLQLGCARLVCPGFEALHAAALVVAQVEAELQAEHDPATGPRPVLDTLPRPGGVPVACCGRGGGEAGQGSRAGASGATANGRAQKQAAGAGAPSSSSLPAVPGPRLSAGCPLDYVIELAVASVRARTLNFSISTESKEGPRAAVRGRVPEDWQWRWRQEVNFEISWLLGLLPDQSTSPVGNRLAGADAQRAVRTASVARAPAARRASRPGGPLSWTQDYPLELLVLMRRDERQE